MSLERTSRAAANGARPATTNRPWWTVPALIATAAVLILAIGYP